MRRRGQAEVRRGDQERGRRCRRRRSRSAATIRRRAPSSSSSTPRSRRSAITPSARRKSRRSRRSPSRRTPIAISCASRRSISTSTRTRFSSRADQPRGGDSLPAAARQPERVAVGQPRARDHDPAAGGGAAAERRHPHRREDLAVEQAGLTRTRLVRRPPRSSSNTVRPPSERRDRALVRDQRRRSALRAPRCVRRRGRNDRAASCRRACRCRPSFAASSARRSTAIDSS